MRLLHLSFAIFLLLFLFQLFTGIYLYVEKYGFSTSSINTYILGSKEQFIQPKTFYGLLKLNFPHFLAMFLTIFVLSHFLYFFKVRIAYFVISGVSFLFAFLDIISIFLILKVSPVFSYLKIISFTGFEISIFLIIFVLFYNIILKIKNRTTENQ